MRVDAANYGFDEATQYDVQYHKQSKTIQNSWVKTARYLYGDTTYQYNVSGDLVLLDHGRKDRSREFSRVSFAYANEGHIIARGQPGGTGDRGGGDAGLQRRPQQRL